MAADSHVHTLGAREKKVRERVFREKPYKTMHICLATDVDVDALIDGKYVDANLFYTEHILFSIRIYTDGLIEGADKLILADLNEETAKLLSLQTRQELGIQALTFAKNTIHSILQLFR